MKSNNRLILSTSPLAQTAKKPRGTASLARRQRPLYGRKRYYSTGKERDLETGLYYFGARYLDSRTGRWISGDPAVGEYVPSAPVDDEARKRNKNLPGQGGVFNYVNLHVYHYAGNNPVRYVDPNGETPADFNKFMKFIKSQGVERTSPTDPYKYERIADSWDDLPESVRKFINFAHLIVGPIATNTGNHEGEQKRLPGGYHIAEEEDENGKTGVFVHHDFIDPTKSPVEALFHAVLEIRFASNSNPQSTDDRHPDWKNEE